MKVSNLVLVFGILVIVSCLKGGMKMQLLQKAAYTRICYDQLVDSALEDGLEAGAAYDGSPFPVIDEKNAVKTFEQSLMRGFDLETGSCEAEELLSAVVCVVILQNRWFSLVDGEKSEQYPYQTIWKEWEIDFCLDGMLFCEHRQTHEQYAGTYEEVRDRLGLPARDQEEISVWRNQVVTECIEKKVEEVMQDRFYTAGYEIDFPVIEEEGCHTLLGISMLGFMHYRPYTIDAYTCSRFTLSGARLVYTE